MRCEKLNVLFFSPNGTTKKSACGVADGMAMMAASVSGRVM